MEIKIPKEVREYHETIFFGLNTRQFVCSLLAVGVAVAVYFLLQPMLDTKKSAGCVFWPPHRLPSADFLPTTA